MLASLPPRLLCQEKSTILNLVASLVEDLIYAPASQAYVEQFFHSVYGVKDREAGEF